VFDFVKLRFVAMKCARLFASLVILGSAAALSAQSSSPARLDAAMRAFWDADSGDAERAAKTVVASGASFDEVRARLKAGRSYARQKTGRIEMPTRDHGLSLDNILDGASEEARRGALANLAERLPADELAALRRAGDGRPRP